MVDVDRVVGGLGQLVQDAHLAAAMAAAEKTVVRNQLFRDGLRAGEREEDAAGTYLRDGAGVEALVALHGITQHLVVLAKAGGSRMIRSYLSSMFLRYSTASAAVSVKLACGPKLSFMFSVASTTARSEESTEQTFSGGAPTMA